MTWTTLSFPYGSTLTSTKMTQLYDNIAAAMLGEPSAPAFKQRFIALRETGTGSDGAMTFTANTTLNPGLYQCTALTVNSGAVVTVAGGLPCVFLVSSLASIEGKITMSTDYSYMLGDQYAHSGVYAGGSGGGGGASALDSTNGSGGGSAYAVAGGGGGSGEGGAGAAGSAKATRHVYEVLNGVPLTGLRGGGGGGHGAYRSLDPGYGTGGPGGGVLVVIGDTVSFASTGELAADGAAGGGGYAGYGIGGGGGGGGGMILVGARVYSSFTGSYHANGGSGGGGSANSGAGGSGGAGITAQITLTNSA